MSDAQDSDFGFFTAALPSRMDGAHDHHLEDGAHSFEILHPLSQPRSQPRHSRSFGTSTLNQMGQGSRPPGLHDIADHFPGINKPTREHSEAYMRLTQANLRLEKENMRLRGENGALREDYAGLLNVIKNHQPTMAANTSPVATSIEVQKTPALKRADMPSVSCWTWDEYTAAKNLRKSNRNGTMAQEKKGAKMLWFIETADGEPIKEELAKAIRRDCRMFWNGMKSVPSRWGRADLNTHSEFSKVMFSKYPELTYCEGSWKLDQIASMDYPSWHNNYMANRVKTEPHLDNTTLKRSTSPITTLAKRRCTSPSLVPSSSKQEDSIHFNNPLSGLFPTTGADTPASSTGRAISPLAIEFMGQQLNAPTEPLGDDGTTALTNELAPVPSSTVSTQPASSTTIANLSTVLGVSIPNVPYTSSITAVISSIPPVPTSSATSDITKKPRKARRPPANSTKPKSVVKSWWMDKYTDGTEKEFIAYWGNLGLEGQRTALLEATQGPEANEIGASAE